MRVFLVLLLVSTAGWSFSQTTSKVVYAKDTGEIKNPPPPFSSVDAGSDGEKVFTIVERQPKFPGGDKALIEYLSSNIKYPKSAKKDKVTGKVLISFVVDKEGNVTEVQVRRGVREDLDAEAYRVVAAMPRWTPAKMGGKIVAVSYNLPIIFKLN